MEEEEEEEEEEEFGAKKDATSSANNSKGISIHLILCLSTCISRILMILFHVYVI